MLSRETYARRHAALRAMMAERGLDALVVYGLAPPLNANLEYVAGECRTHGLALFPAEGEAVLWVQPKALVPFVRRTAIIEVRNGGIDYSDELIGELRARRLDRGAIGLVEVDSLRTRGIPHLLYERLKADLPAARFDTVTEAYEAVRNLLLPEEQALLERAAEDLDRVIDFYVDAVRPGVSLAEVVAATHAFSKERDLGLSALSARAAAMDRSTSILDPAAASRTLQRGDYVFFESNAARGPFRAYRGFPIALGEPPPEVHTLFETALEVARCVVAALRPGGTTSEAARCGDVVPARGLWCHGPLATGQSTGGWQMICVRGFDGYRPPTEIIFRPGMAFTVFPHLMTPDNSVITIVGTSVLVGEDGPRILGRQGLRYVVQ
ncbi:MAG: aminopeptidase P family N-terminal domain-containing protein [Chloroflexota bacterium]|nr:aminopeptidase P family N-terminal domain-containing protein [Dehalococcoidia bacterium]MDW8254781.1 aminopeptidase P family N-terminal domain-containing protein [Chloroflexota bacterium]